MSKSNVMAKTVLDKLVKAFSGAMKGATDHSGFIHTVCVAVSEDYPESAPPAAHQTQVVEGLIKTNPQWAERTGEERGREARAIMDTHWELERYCDSVKADKRNGPNWTWHNAVKVARIIRRLKKKAKGKSPTLTAVRNTYFKRAEASATDPGLTVLNSVIKNLDPRSNLYRELVQVFEKHEYVIEG